MKLFLCINMFFFPTLLWATNPVNEAFDLIKAGSHKEGVAKIEALYKKSSNDPLTLYAYAKTRSSGKEAEKLYQSLIAMKKNPPELRHKSYFELGNYYLVQNDYGKAQTMFHNALKIKTLTKYLHYYALSHFYDGHYNNAYPLWLRIFEAPSEKAAWRASLWLGHLFFAQKKYDQAFSWYNRASKSTEIDVHLAASVGKSEAALHTQGESLHTFYYTQVGTKAPHSLYYPHSAPTIESNTTTKDTTISMVVKSDTTSKEQSKIDTSNIIANGVFYTIQVGAFSEKDNAERMKSRVGKKFKNLRIEEMVIKNKLYYKVCIGQYSSKEDAQTFAESSLDKSPFRIIKIEK